MDKKKVRIAIYKMHDYDLVKYCVSLKDKSLNNPKTSIASVIKEALNSYILGVEYSAPEISTYTSEDGKSLPSKINIRITLDPKEDAKTIELIENIKDRQINSFIKSLLRRSMLTNGLRCYYSKDYTPESELGVKKKIAKEKKIEEKSRKLIGKITEKPALKEERVVISEVKEEPETDNSFDFWGTLGPVNA